MIGLLLAAGIVHSIVDISAVLHDGSARVHLRFAREAAEVRVTLRGEDGLVVDSDKEPIKGQAIAPGARIPLEVSFTPGPNQSTLRVEVTGKADGAPFTVTRAFKTGIPSDDQRHQARERGTAPRRRVPLEN